MAVGQRGQVPPAIEGQRRAGGVLEVGHDVAQAGTQPGHKALLQQVGSQAVAVGRDRDEVGVASRQRLEGADVRRRLHHDMVARIDQGAGQQVQTLLRPGGDEHVLGPALAAPGLVGLGHPLPQGRDPLGRAVLDGLWPVAPGPGQHGVGGRRSRSTGKLSGAGRPPAIDSTSGRVVRCSRSRMIEDVTLRPRRDSRPSGAGVSVCGRGAIPPAFTPDARRGKRDPEARWWVTRCAGSV